jgi:hypothetical protein
VCVCVCARARVRVRACSGTWLVFGKWLVANVYMEWLVANVYMEWLVANVYMEWLVANVCVRACIITTVCFITFLINRSKDRLLSLPRQFLYILRRMNKFTDLRVN